MKKKQIIEKLVKGFVCVVLYLFPFMLLEMIQTESTTVYHTWENVVGYTAIFVFCASHMLVCAAIFKAWTE